MLVQDKLTTASDLDHRLFTGISRIEFETLIKLLQSNVTVSKSQQQELNFRQRLLLFLMWMKLYLPLRSFAFMYDIQESTIHQYIIDMLDFLYIHLKDRVTFSDYQFRKSHGVYYGHHLITIIIDGMNQVIWKPQDMRKLAELLFSGKDKEYELTTLIVVTADGFVLFVGRSAEGSLGDSAKILSQDYFLPIKHAIQETDEHVLGDSAFSGMTQVFGERAFSTPRRKKGDERHAQLSSYRAIVENVILRFRRWGICSQVLHHTVSDVEKLQEFHHKVLVVVAALHNMFDAPLR